MYIEKIKSPAFLKGLNLEELNIVADETRQAVLNRVSKHGGHVGPNLGAKLDRCRAFVAVRFQALWHRIYLPDESFFADLLAQIGSTCRVRR